MCSEVRNNCCADHLEDIGIKPIHMRVNAILMTVAILVIAAVGAAGLFQSTEFGWLIAGLTTSTVLMHLSVADCEMVKKNKTVLSISLLVAVAFATLGVLQATQVLSAPVVGWSICGTVMSMMVVMPIVHSVQLAREACGHK